VSYALECDRLLQEHYREEREIEAREFEEKEKKRKEKSLERERQDKLWRNVDDYVLRSIDRIGKMPRRSKYQKLLVREEINSVLRMADYLTNKLPDDFVYVHGSAFMERKRKYAKDMLMQLEKKCAG
jgi:hypothetical protein